MKMKPFQRGYGPGDALYFLNGKYQVILTKERDREGADVLHLSIRREDRRPIMDWRDVQIIKNELVGAEEEAVQLFPAESRLVDGSNQFHLYCYLGKSFAFGFPERAVSESVQIIGPTGQASVQRPFAPEHRPADLEEQEAKAREIIREMGLQEAI
jgi:hypothetical protein